MVIQRLLVDVSALTSVGLSSCLLHCPHPKQKDLSEYKGLLMNIMFQKNERVCFS